MVIQSNANNSANATSTFIYNAIPKDPSATITPEYSKAINTFSVNLLRASNKDSLFANRNLALSPFSVSRALAVLTEGTTGTSHQELMDALGGQKALDDAKSALGELLYADQSVTLQCADALWLGNPYSLKATFRQRANSQYGVEVSPIDFNNATNAANTINNWTAKNTNNYITNIVSAKDFADHPVFILANAIYFKANWTSPFDASKTQKSDFYSPSGTIQVDMMESTYRFATRKTDVYENAKLYYGDRANYFYLDIYMPIKTSIPDFIRDHALPALSAQDAAMQGAVKMPKFFFTTDMDLVPMLKTLGIKGIFNPLQGEMVNILETPVDNLYISMVRHRAGIKTDEEGTVAYAQTVASGGAGSAPTPPSPDIIFNKPFVYFIRAGKNGLVLFAGVVNNPGVSQ